MLYYTAKLLLVTVILPYSIACARNVNAGFPDYIMTKALLSVIIRVLLGSGLKQVD